MDPYFFHQFLSNAMTIATPTIGIWLGIWGLRQRLESDYKLDRTARAVRWCIVLICWVIGSIPGHGRRPLSGLALIVGLAFLWWPNFAYHFVRGVRWSVGKIRGTERREQQT